MHMYSSHDYYSRAAFISDKLLTCTDDSISSVARVARTFETPFCVSAVCILMTVVQDITRTLINVCMKTLRYMYSSTHMTITIVVCR